MLQLVRDYGKRDVSWSVGSLFAHDRYVWNLVDILKDLGYDNPIKGVFGSIPCLFQGGRISPRDAKISDALEIIKHYNDKNISCRLTYSNIFIETKDLEDSLCNEFLSFVDNQNKENQKIRNGVIITSDKLADYIRDKYPNLELISSITKPVVEVGLGSDEENYEYYNRLFVLYDMVSINPYKVQDGIFLSKIEYPERVEFIANSRCLPNCMLARNHYEKISIICKKLISGEDAQYEFDTISSIKSECTKIKSMYPLAGISLSQSDIEGLVRMGFRNFSITGRENEGPCFIRDIGDYIFIPYLYKRIASAIMKGNI